VKQRSRRAAGVLASYGAMSVGTGAGDKWRAHRFGGPYLRDELLDRGVMVETLETATSWTHLAALYAAVRSALADAISARGATPLVMCHVSHLYESGASLYFTFLGRQEVGSELEQWRAVKTAASEAIVAAGGTITHHHAVGTDHRDYLAAEIGDLGVATLRAVKDRLDPTGILNPGKLIP
jgi:alkyldihydroxyacetonephosphate synthase